MSKSTENLEAAQIVSNKKWTRKSYVDFIKCQKKTTQSSKQNTNTRCPSPRSQTEANDSKDAVFKFSNMDSSGYCVLFMAQWSHNNYQGPGVDSKIRSKHSQMMNITNKVDIYGAQFLVIILPGMRSLWATIFTVCTMTFLLFMWFRCCTSYMVVIFHPIMVMVLIVMITTVISMMVVILLRVMIRVSMSTSMLILAMPTTIILRLIVTVPFSMLVPLMFRFHTIIFRLPITWTPISVPDIIISIPFTVSITVPIPVTIPCPISITSTISISIPIPVSCPVSVSVVSILSIITIPDPFMRMLPWSLPISISIPTFFTWYFPVPKWSQPTVIKISDLRNILWKNII